MAVNVDLVYKTVLLILNKEQRGYITPEEFNKIGSQVQQEIFETYFEDLNQQLRVPQTDAEYANRQKNIDNNIAIFKTFGSCTYTNPGGGVVPYYAPPVNTHRIGTIIYKDEIEVERVQKNDLLYLNLSTLTKPTTSFPIYLYENSTAGVLGTPNSVPKIYVSPKTITGVNDISCSYIRKPNDIVWGYKGLGNVTWTTGPYIYDAATSMDFELSPTEKTNIIIKILGYAGVIIRDPEIVQAASQKSQSEEVNSKS
jgi:hypothetical protein